MKRLLLRPKHLYTTMSNLIPALPGGSSVRPRSPGAVERFAPGMLNIASTITTIIMVMNITIIIVDIIIDLIVVSVHIGTLV